MIEGLLQDLRHGARMLVKNPGFTLIAMLSIAVGVGANAAMFSLADGLVLRPVAAPRASELVAVTSLSPSADAPVFFGNRYVSYPDYVDLRDRAQSFSSLMAYTVVLTGFAGNSDEPPQRKLGLGVTGNFFGVLDLQPALGRFFVPEEDRVPGRDAVIVLAHETWAEQFGSDPAVLGRRVRVGGVDFTVIGVAPASFTGMHLVLPPHFYVPMAMTPSLAGESPRALEQRQARAIDVRGLLKPGVSVEQATQEAALIAAGLEKAFPDTNRNIGMMVKTALDARLEERGPSAPSVFTLMTLALVVLLVACANVAGLLLSRAPERQREIGLRLAIGGGRFRLVRQLLTESLLLAVGGGILGLAVGYGGVVLLHQLPIISDIGVRIRFDLDRRAITVGLTLAAASVILSSLVPAWRATRATDLTTTLRTGTARLERLSRLWGRNALVAIQVALSLVLLTVTAFLSRSFEAELNRPGFRTERMLLAGFEPELASYDASRTDGFYRLLKERARAIPGVTSVGMTSILPLNQDNRESRRIVPEGFQLPQGTENVPILSSRIDEGYLETMAIPIVRGRGFQSNDTADSRLVVLVNVTMANRYWPGQDPIGKRIQLVDREGRPWAEVVGTAADNKYNWIGEAPTPWLYVPWQQDPGPRATLLVASSGSSSGLASPVRQIVREIDSNMPISGMRTMEDYYHGNAVGIVTTLLRITGSMGLMGMAMAVVGLYGLVAYFVARRTREIGIRMAVGAKTSSILRLVLRHGLMLTALGVVLGVIGSVAAGGLLQSLFENAANTGIDLGTYLLVVPSLVAVAMLAAYIPARRAARIDPLKALRQE
jgi:predicted permease